jgi:hypothetical protein
MYSSVLFSPGGRRTLCISVIFARCSTHMFKGAQPLLVWRTAGYALLRTKQSRSVYSTASEVIPTSLMWIGVEQWNLGLLERSGSRAIFCARGNNLLNEGLRHGLWLLRWHQTTLTMLSLYVNCGTNVLSNNAIILPRQFSFSKNEGNSEFSSEVVIRSRSSHHQRDTQQL